ALHESQIGRRLAACGWLLIPTGTIQPDQLTLPANAGNTLAGAGLDHVTFRVHSKPSVSDFFRSQSTSTCSLPIWRYRRSSRASSSLLSGRSLALSNDSTIRCWARLFQLLICDAWTPYCDDSCAT